MKKSQDLLKWVAAACALVATASAEYELARAIGMNEWVALAVPGALDAYVVRALRSHREVLTAVLAMVGVNAASKLLAAGLIPLDWRLITAVSAIAPLVLWRVHALSTPGEARRHLLWRGRVPSTDDPVPDAREHMRESGAQTCSQGCEVWGDLDRHECEHGLLAGDVNTGRTTAEWDRHLNDTPGLIDYVPAEWSRPPAEWPEHGSTAPCASCSVTVTYDGARGWEHPAGSTCVLVEYDGPFRDDDEPVTAGVLALVPPLPDGYEVAELSPDDMAFMAQARELESRDGRVTVRVLKAELGTGTPRAQRLRKALDAEARARTEKGWET